MRFKYEIEIEVEREEGKFASRDEINDELREALEGANPEEVSGIGADGSSIYNVVQFEVSEVTA